MRTSMAEPLLKKKYTVIGMDCADCALHLENEVKKITGIASVQVNSVTGEMDISSAHTIADHIIQNAVHQAGYVLGSDLLQRSTFTVTGMDCAQEEVAIRKGLEKINGIQDIKFNLVQSELHVVHTIPRQKIISGLEKIGFQARLCDAENKKIPDHSAPARLTYAMFLSAGCTLLGVATLYGLSMPNLSLMLFVFGIISGGYSIAIKGIREASQLRPGMNLLMTLAVIGAMIIGEWLEAATVIFLFGLAQYLESRTMDKARRSISNLIDQKPRFATVRLHGEFIQIAAEEVQVGQRVVVKAGERIPVDGLVVQGKAHIDQSTITGESIPVRVTTGDRVYGGTINQNGFLEIQAERTAGDSTFSKIVELVSQAQSQKASQQTFIEKFALYYTPVVLFIALGIALIPPIFFNARFPDWFYRALVILVIACPCALVISTPVTIISGLTAAMRHGILIKGGIYLENFSHLQVMAFDKTGTLTEGKPRVQEIYLCADRSSENVLSIAASIEQRSDHPIARAICLYAQSQKSKTYEVTEFNSIDGKGIEGKIDGHLYVMGNHKLFEERNLCNADMHQLLTKIEDQNHTAVLVGNQYTVLGIISIADSVRTDAWETLQLLRKEGIQKLILLSGDNHRTTEGVAHTLKMDKYYAELLPQEKVRTLEELKSEFGRVAMVGDGVNDAPAIAAADIGIAMGACGSEVAIETADIALMDDNLIKLITLKKISNFTLRLIRQNIVIALGLKFIFLILATLGLATLWMAVFADMGASLMVIANGMRVLTQK